MTARHQGYIERFHVMVGLSASVCALGHLIAIVWTREGIKPYSNLGWLREQLLVGVAVLLPGVAILSSIRMFRRGRLVVPLAAAASLALVSCAEILRYFTPMPTIFALLALIDAALVASLLHRRWLAGAMSALFSVWLAGTALLLFASYTGAGE
jgi:hypothetical protein